MMNKQSIYLLTLIVITTFIPHLTVASEAEDYSKTINEFKLSPQAKPFFANAWGYAVFPTIGKGGFVVGAAYGKGQVYEHGEVTGITRLLKASAGLQIGAQAYSQMIFFEDKRAYDEFTTGEFGFDAQASAVVLTGGAHAQSGSTGATASEKAGKMETVQHAQTSYRKGMAIFVNLKGGAMFEVSLAGQKFSFKPL